MNIGIYGGSFNPPHKGHYKVMETVIPRLTLDKLLLLPSKNPPHKELAPHTPPDQERFYLLETMADTLRHSLKGKSNCKIETLDLEMQREGKSYTIDSLRTLAEQYPNDHLWLILGEDMLLCFDKWHQAPEICKLASLCTFMRSDKAPSPALLAKSKEIQSNYEAHVLHLTLDEGTTASSTAVRADLSKLSFSPDLLPSIAGRILSHQSYGLKVSLSNLDLPLLRSVVWGEVRAKRIAHAADLEDLAQTKTN